MRSHATVLFALALGACAAPSSPPPSVAPSPRPVAPVSPPAWAQRTSVADGYERAVIGSTPVLIRNATLLLATGKTVKNGSILLQGGKIAAVSEGELAAPAGAEVIDGTGKFVTPGIIDTHSHLGVYPLLGAKAHADGNEMTDPTTPAAQTVDAFWAEDPSIERAVAGGVTTIQVLPGSGNLIGGRAITVKLREGESAREMHFGGAPDGLKMACGENPKRVYGEKGRMPMSRMGNLALQRAAFLKAKKLERDYAKWVTGETKRLEGDEKARAKYEAEVKDRAAKARYCEGRDADETCAGWRKAWSDKPLEQPEPSEPAPPPDRDPGLETLIGAMQGKVLVHVHCYRADDMLSMLALSDEMGFSVRSFHHALEAYKIRDELTRRGVSVSTWADWWGFKMEAYDGIPENLALVHQAGGRAIVHTDSPEGIQRMNQEAAKGLESGRARGMALTEEDAIRWITANPAWALGIESRVGTLEVGKDADVVLWDRSPFSVYASAERVWIDGAPRYQKGQKTRWSDLELGQDAQKEPQGGLR